MADGENMTNNIKISLSCLISGVSKGKVVWTYCSQMYFASTEKVRSLVCNWTVTVWRSRKRSINLSSDITLWSGTWHDRRLNSNSDSCQYAMRSACDA